MGDNNRRIIYKTHNLTNLGTIAGDATSRRKSRDVAPKVMHSGMQVSGYGTRDDAKGHPDR